MAPGAPADRRFPRVPGIRIARAGGGLHPRPPSLLEWVGPFDAGPQIGAPSVELHQLQCFIAVLEEGGFKRATARLGITQPALSYQIKRLEEELGVQVFRRGPGGITPTEAGRVLFDHAHQIIATVREAHQAVRELSGGVSGAIRGGAIKCMGTYFLPRVLWEVQARHPLVRPKILYRDSDELLEAVVANRLDVAMAVDPPPDPRFRYEIGRASCR